MVVNLNGEMLPAEQPILRATNRSFRFGDGLFESIRVFDGRLPFLSLHWERLQAGFRLLGLAVPDHVDAAFFAKEIGKLTAGSGNWRVRLTVWRGGGGLYTPASSEMEFLVEAAPLPSAKFELDAAGLRLGVFDKHLLPAYLPGIGAEPLSVKTANALPQVLASLFRQERGLDDCLLLNCFGRVACATSANVFFVKDGTLLTPELHEGSIAGTMRSTTMTLAQRLDIPCSTTKALLSDLAAADEIFLTNAIQGIRWVRRLDFAEGELNGRLAEVLVEKINEIALSDGEG